MKVLIDAGHGADTPGKRSPDGSFLEYRWNREVAERVMSLLRGAVPCEMIVEGEEDIPLRERVRRVNMICDTEGAKNVILVSIHANAAGDGSRWMNAEGWSCYTTKGETESDKIAECLYDSFEESFPDRKIRKDISDGDRDFEENFYLLRMTRCPAVLLENFFYDNVEECYWMIKEETKERIARSIAKGIKDYLRSL